MLRTPKQSVSDRKKRPWITAEQVWFGYEEKFFMERVVKPLNRLPGAVMESPVAPEDTGD